MAWIGFVRASIRCARHCADLDCATGSTGTSMVLRLAAVLIFAPSFLFPAISVAAFGGWLGQVYVKAQLSVKREMSIAKAPVLGILGGAINGLRMFHMFLLYALVPVMILFAQLPSVHMAHRLHSSRRYLAG